MKFLKKHWVILLILFFSFVLRVYKLEERFVFGFNEEYQATLAQSIVDNFHLIWVGVSAAHLEFYIGPLFTYLTSLLLYIGRSDPLVAGFFSVILGVISTYLIYMLGLRVFGKITSYLGAAIYTISPLFIFFDQKYWNPTPNIFLSLLIILVVMKARTVFWYWVLFFVLFALIFHADLAAIPIVFVGLVIFFKNLFIIPKKIILLCFLTFTLIYSPLLVFDYHHNFSNLLTPFRMREITRDYNFASSPLNHAYVFSAAVTKIWYLDPYTESTDESLSTCDPLAFGLGSSHIGYPNERTVPPVTLQVLFTIITLLFVFCLMREKLWERRFIGMNILVFLFFFLLFPGGTFEYYLLTILPLFVFIPGFFIEKTNGISRILIFVFLLIFLTLSFYTIYTAKAEYGLGVKKQIIKEVSGVVKDQPFEIRERGLCHGLEGWRYLFNAYGSKPVKSSIDATLGWIYPEKIKNSDLKYEVIISEKRTPLNTKIVHPLEVHPNKDGYFELLRTIDKGGFVVYIYDISRSGSVWD